MNPTDQESVADVVEQEGFDYAFRHYSDFKQIKDVHFHRLRKAYKDAAEELIEYVGMDY